MGIVVVEVRAVIEGQDVTRDEIASWEEARLPNAARRIGLPVPSGDLAQQRLAFADAKIDLGHAEISRRLSRALKVSELVSRTSTAMARGGRKTSVCDLHVTGVAQTRPGANIGGVRHQFRDVEGGFHARLLVEFPSTVLPTMIQEHRWHLATEFTNWVELAFTPD